MNPGCNQGGLQRGDRKDTGDLEARPTEPGDYEDLEDLTVREATDPELGLTGIGNVPAQDWAAGTGPDRSPEAASHGVDRRLTDKDRAPDGHRIDFENRDKK
jgi:hypothetical protein